MNAPDAHWLLVKQEWLPIEALLDHLVPFAENTHDRVESLQGRLDSQCIRDLHTLRLQRNRVLHKNEALSNPLQWRATALRVRHELETLHKSRTPVNRFGAPSLTRPTSGTRRPVQPAGLSQQSYLAVRPVGGEPIAPHKPLPAPLDANSGSVRTVQGLLFEKLVFVVLWCAASWWMESILQSLIAQVAPLSVAWWILGLGWLLCLPGIAVAYLVMGVGHVLWFIGSALVGALIWLVQYAINNPY